MPFNGHPQGMPLLLTYRVFNATDYVYSIAVGMTHRQI